MIGYLQGELIAHDPLGHADQVIILVAGVGYQVMLPSGVITSAVGGQVSVWIHAITREDGTRLYGFAERDNIKGFTLLLDISGVGAKVALALLSAYGWSGVAQAIAAGDVTALTRAEGVGKKIAQRIINELSSKLDHLFTTTTAMSGVAGLGASVTALGTSDSASTSMLAAQAVSALSNLGYHTNMAQQAVQYVQSEQPHLSLEQIIPAALQRLSQA